MARKNKGGSKKRTSQKILDAYQIAEKAERRKNGKSDSESDDEYGGGVFNAKKLLCQEERDGSDESELEDEEIDSDEALGSDDDYDVLNSKYSQTLRDKSKARKKKDYESEGEEDYDSIDEGELVPLSEVWDMDDKDLVKTKISKKSENNDIVLDDKWDSVSSESDEDSESETGSESEDDNEEEPESDQDVFAGLSDGDEETELTQTVAALRKQLQKPRSKKRLINERTSEHESKLPNTGKKSTLADMLAAVDKSVVKDSLLITNKVEEDSADSKALAVPLPKRIQDRHERKVAYEITKDEVNKWEDTIKQNRRAEVLKFPLNPNIEHNEASSFQTDVQPTTELEKKVHSLLQESSLVDDTKEATFEEIATSKMSAEDIKKRTNELRMMRELMFREEKKAKRVKKIKSKLYHKIKKRETMRNQQLVEGDESDAEDHDMKRAKERMTLKHKTQSNWAKSMIKSGLSKDASNREELEEMLRQGERLRSKVLGHEDGDQSDKDISDIERDDREIDEEDDEVQRSKLGKGVLAMDFMKNAEEKQKQENVRQIELLRRLENGEDVDELSEDFNSANVNKNQGRRVYTPSASALKESVIDSQKKTLEELEYDDEKSLKNKISKKFAVAASGAKSIKAKANSAVDANDEATEDAESNPWLVSESKTQKSKKISKVDKDSSKFEKSAMKIKKSKKRSGNEMDNEDSLIDMNETLKVVDAFGSDNEQGDDDDSAVPMFKQKHLIREAFASDDVVAEFEQEKKQVIMDEDDKEEDLTLPGWGDWAGGDKKHKKKKIVKKVKGVMSKDKRKDKNLKNVIINEKTNKKNLKYQSSAVPFPYESREQYERALRMPIGQEWTSRATHQKLTMPKVIVKQGTVIDPLKKPTN